MSLRGKKIAVGITGGIAAYKICDLIRLLIKAGAEVKAVLTPGALNFVTELTLKTLTKNPIYVEQFVDTEWKPEHISLADEADMFVIAPASANTIGKISNGICDNLLTSLLAAFNKPVIFAPAMNCNMWNNQFVQQNVNKLVNAGYHMVPPAIGELACGYEGVGRLADINDIFDKITEVLLGQGVLSGKKIIVTAGGTKESIDPVRYLGNKSSGKMGTAIADVAYDLGAEVCLISTIKQNKPYQVINVNTAQEMLETLNIEFPKTDVLVMVAAVADYRVKEFSEKKIKKDNRDEISLELVKNPDIIREMAKIKKSSQVLAGFCAETENLKENALRKLEEKNLDFIVANDVSNKDIGFESDYNVVTVYSKENKDPQPSPKLLKTEIAKLILQKIFVFNELEVAVK